MTTFNERDYFTGTAEYDRHFWNVMKGGKDVTDTLSKGSARESGGFYDDCVVCYFYENVLPASREGFTPPSGAEDKYSKAIRKESIFRNPATVIHAYGGSSRIFAKDCEDIAAWVPEGGAIPIYDAVNDFTRYPVDMHKLAVFVKLDDDFIRDATFDIEDYLTKRLARCFAKAEDAAFLNGNGLSAPTGILNAETGATVGVTTDALTFDSVIRLFFALDPDYRKNAVWMMNDETALALRLLKDENGNHLWDHANDTILGKPVVIANDMPSVGSGNTPILFGDFSYYWIVCRSPVSVRTLKEKFVTLDQVGYLAMEFMDAKLVRREAVQALQIA